MAKVFVIPDIHLKPWIFDKAEEWLSKNEYDQIVCLGDIADDWNQGLNIGLYRKTFSALTSFAKNHPNMLFCYGNHDVSYMWEALETGYSDAARESVLYGLDTLKLALPPENIAFIHRIDNVLFSHSGLTELFVSHFFPDWQEKGDFNDLIKRINASGKTEMWCDVSPIWARPQDGDLELYGSFMQIVGHTPVKKTDHFGNLLTVDNFSTYHDSTPIGDQRFVWVDTTFRQWGFVDNGDMPETSANNRISDIRNYRTGDWVLFRISKSEGEYEYREGIVEIIDRYPDGFSSIDVMCKNILYKHIPLADVLDRIRVGIDGDSCVLPPRWESSPGKIMERKSCD